MRGFSYWRCFMQRQQMFWSSGNTNRLKGWLTSAERDVPSNSAARRFASRINPCSLMVKYPTGARSYNPTYRELDASSSASLFRRLSICISSSVWCWWSSFISSTELPAAGIPWLFVKLSGFGAFTPTLPDRILFFLIAICITGKNIFDIVNLVYV